MKVKWVLIPVLIVFFLLVLYVVSVSDNVAEKSPFLKIDESVFSGSANCTDIDTGWLCKFSVNKSKSEMWKESGIVKAYKEECERQGGKWRCYGYCLPSYNHYCDFKYKDAGKLCIASWQCGGKCITENAGFPKIGKCSEYPLRECDRFTEVSYGFTKTNSRICD